MIDYDFDKYCSGCGACENVCPVKAIQLVEDAKGFLQPYVDKDKCIQCGKCDRVCPHIHLSQKENKYEHIVKGAWIYASEDAAAKMRSSSGGAFYELAKKFVEQEQYVCGCVWDKNLRAVHIVDNTFESIQKMQGSKYVQSEMKDCYEKILYVLKKGHKVMFSGTPCQAVAMHQVVMETEAGKYRPNLLITAVLCHGVASPMAWESYKKYEITKKKSRLMNVNFRDKSIEGYKKSYCKYDFESGETVFVPTYLPTSKYIEATLVYNLAIRECCSHCESKGINEAIDILMGDWYAEYKGKGELGTSCVVAFTEKGKECILEYLDDCRKIPYEDVVHNNPYIVDSIKLGKLREAFFQNINDYHFWDNVEKLYPPKYILKKLLVKINIYPVIVKVKKLIRH